MIPFRTVVVLVVCIISFSSCKETPSHDIDLLLTNAKIWTGEQAEPWANWVAIADEKIVALGSENDLPPDATEKIDLNGQLALPGFNDSHVHFASAGALLLGINLLDVNDMEGLQREIIGATERLPKGSWITRGDWGAYEAWGKGSDGSSTNSSIFTPHRSMIDNLTPDHPVLINRYDRTEGLANAVALEALGIESETGLLTGAFFREALDQIPEKSTERKLAEARRALQECRKFGVTTVQDMSPLDRVDIYKEIQQEGGLTCRINFAPSKLSDYELMATRGWTIKEKDGKVEPAGDDWISYGTLKTHIDGIMGARTARFYQPYSDNILERADWRGSWREFSDDMRSFKDMIIAADQEDIQLRIHAIGDQANSILVDIVDTLNLVNGNKPRRFRIVHAQVIAPEDFGRFAGKDMIAEVQPYHVTDDMRWMEERISYERCKGAYAFQSLKQLGCTLSFGSDWPGTNASYYPINPLMGLYAAVTRQTIEGAPEGGWFPEQRISLEDALVAYTHGAAYGAFEENRKGTIRVGKMADIAVIDTDLFNTEPQEWLEANFLYTIVGGKVVYEADNK